MPLHCLAIAIVTYFVVLLLACLRWTLLLRSFQIRIKFSLAFQLMFIGLYFNNMMPSLTGGDVVKAYYTAKGTSKKMEAVASILLDRIFGVFALFLLAVFGSFFVLHHPELGGPARLILICVGLFFVGITLFLNRKLLNKFSWVKGRLEKWGWINGIRRFYNAITVLRHKADAAGIVLLLSLMIQSLLVYINFVLARGLGMADVSFSKFFILIPLVGLISAMPVSFAGWGIGEGAYRGLFMMLNPAYGPIAVALSIILRSMCLIISLLGFPLYLMYRHEPIDKSSKV